MTRLARTVAVAAALLLPLTATQAAPATAQEDAAAQKRERKNLPDNTLTFNPLSFVLAGGDPLRTPDNEHLMSQTLGLYSLEYERVLGGNVSLYVAPAYLRFARYTGAVPVSGFGGALGFRYFFLGEAPGGPWAGAQLHVNTFSGGAKDSLGGESTYSSSSVGGGAMVGYTLLIANAIDLSLGAGLGANRTSLSTHNRIPWQQLNYTYETQSVDRVLLLRLNLGFAF